MHPYNFGTSGDILLKLSQPTCCDTGVITCVQFLEGPSPKIWEGPKNVQISARFLTTFDFDSEYPRNGSARQISGHNISVLKGCCALKFLHALEIDQGYLAHTPTGTGFPKKNSNRENLKFALKFSVCTPITSGLVGISS